MAALSYESEGRAFESLRARHLSFVKVTHRVFLFLSNFVRRARDELPIKFRSDTNPNRGLLAIRQ